MALTFLRRSTPLPANFRSSFSTAMKASRRNITFSSHLITPKELAVALQKNPKTKISTAPRIIPLCAAWFLPNDPEKRTGLSVFEKKHIPGARFFDLDAVSDSSSPYPHMLPSSEKFAEAMGGLGIRRDDEIVVYDTEELGIFSAPRVSWTLKVFGHSKVHLLNNFKIWVAEGYQTESGPPEQVERVEYPIPILDQSKVIGFEQVKETAQDYGKEGAEGVQILDARSLGRWEGSQPEPRPGLSSGHIPGSFSVPMPELLDPTTKAFLPKAELLEVFQSKHIDPAKPIINSCGTGVTAAVIDAALQEAGFGDAHQRRLYDGSWTEWAQRVTEAEGLIKKSR